MAKAFNKTFRGRGGGGGGRGSWRGRGGGRGGGSSSSRGGMKAAPVLATEQEGTREGEKAEDAKVSGSTLVTSTGGA